MIESPKNFIEQFQNFIEHIAGVMKTFLTKEVADNYYLGKTEKAVSADTAGTATKATQDANGNVIPDTYATKAELTKDVQQLQTGLATLEANAVKSVNGVTPTAGNVNVDIPKNIWGLPTSVFVDTTDDFTAEKNGFYVAGRPNTGTGHLYVNGQLWMNPNDYGHGVIPFKAGDHITTSGLSGQRYFYTE